MSRSQDRLILSLSLFVMVFFVPLEDFALNWRRHHCQCGTENVDLWSASMAIEQ